MPLYINYKGVSFSINDWQYWLWSSFYMVPTAALAIIIKMPERLDNIIDFSLFNTHIRFSEIQEFYFAYFYRYIY